MMRNNCKKNINGKDSERFGKIRISTFKYFYVRLLCCFFIFVVFSLSSCDNVELEDLAAENTLETYQLDEKVCTDFAVKMHTSLANGDTNFINSYVDWAGIQNLISADTGYWESEMGEIFNSWKSNISIGQDLIGELVSGNHLRFITYYQLDGEHFVILRNYIEPQTVNYFEFRLKSNGATMAIADVYDFSQSKLLSKMGKEYCDYYGKYQSTWKTEKSEMDKRQLIINEKMSQGDLNGAYLKLIELETAYQNTYMFESVKETILLQSSVESLALNYLFNKSQRIAINEKGRNLTMFYLNAYNGNNNDALIALANIEDAVGEDGVLDYLRGNLYFEDDKKQKALEAFNKALSYDNEIISFHIAKIKTLIEMELYVEAVESLLVMDDSFEIKNITWDQEFITYPDFLASDQYATWKKSIED